MIQNAFKRITLITFNAEKQKNQQKLYYIFQIKNAKYKMKLRNNKK